MKLQSTGAQSKAKDAGALLKQLDQLVGKHRAAQAQVEESDLIKTVRGGKVIWITRDEMNKILTRNRKVAGLKVSNKKQDEDDTANSAISRQIQYFHSLVKTVRNWMPECSEELGRKARELEAKGNQIQSLSSQLRLLESALRNKKFEDPLLQEMDQAGSDMVAALESKNLSKAVQMRAFQRDHEQDMAMKRKRLTPFHKKTISCRAAYAQAKCRFYALQIDIMRVLSKNIPKRGSALSTSDVDAAKNSNMSMGDRVNEADSHLAEFERLGNKNLMEMTKSFQAFEHETLHPLIEVTRELVDSLEIQKADSNTASLRGG